MKIVEVIKKAAERHNATPAQVRAAKRGASARVSDHRRSFPSRG
jgi:hypothetical protein